MFVDIRPSDTSTYVHTVVGTGSYITSTTCTTKTDFTYRFNSGGISQRNTTGTRATFFKRRVRVETIPVDVGLKNNPPLWEVFSMVSAGR